MAATADQPRFTWAAALVAFPFCAALVVVPVFAFVLDQPDDLGNLIGLSALLSAALTAATVARWPGRSTLQRVWLVTASALMTFGWFYVALFTLLIVGMLGCSDGRECAP